jgi:hypothetical protein
VILKEQYSSVTSSERVVDFVSEALDVVLCKLVSQSPRLDLSLLIGHLWHGNGLTILGKTFGVTFDHGIPDFLVHIPSDQNSTRLLHIEGVGRVFYRRLDQLLELIIAQRGSISELIDSPSGLHMSITEYFGKNGGLPVALMSSAEERRWGRG